MACVAVVIFTMFHGATVAKVIDLCDDGPFCPVLEKSERPLQCFNWKMAGG